MTKQEKFVKVVEELFTDIEVEEDVLDYFETVKKKKRASKNVEMTENGANIVEYMQEHWEETDNKFLSREIGEGLFTSSRSVSGAMRKLVTDDYVDKSEDSPIVYSLTEKGKEYSK